jgi:hypothetical protein
MQPEANMKWNNSIHPPRPPPQKNPLTSGNTIKYVIFVAPLQVTYFVIKLSKEIPIIIWNTITLVWCTMIFQTRTNCKVAKVNILKNEETILKNCKNSVQFASFVQFVQQCSYLSLKINCFVVPQDILKSLYFCPVSSLCGFYSVQCPGQFYQKIIDWNFKCCVIQGYFTSLEGDRDIKTRKSQTIFWQVVQSFKCPNKALSIFLPKHQLVLPN